jgi:hypothetical protein
MRKVLSLKLLINLRRTTDVILYDEGTVIVDGRLLFDRSKANEVAI